MSRHIQLTDEDTSYLASTRVGIIEEWLGYRRAMWAYCHTTGRSIIESVCHLAALYLVPYERSDHVFATHVLGNAITTLLRVDQPWVIRMVGKNILETFKFGNDFSCCHLVDSKDVGGFCPEGKRIALKMLSTPAILLRILTLLRSAELVDPPIILAF